MRETIFSDLSIGVMGIVFLGVFLATGNLIKAGLLVGVVVMLVVVNERGWFTSLVVRAGSWLKRLAGWLSRERDAAAGRALYEMVLGYDPATGLKDVEKLTDLGHVGVYGTRRFGKTTLLHSFIHDLITNHDPTELRLLIVDPKEFDYSFYAGLPHLLKPIARDATETAVLVKFLQEEMDYRRSLFEPYAKKALCNDLERYEALSGKRLPLILMVFDELADVIDPGSQLEVDLVRLAKICGGVGIQFVFATQRPSSKVVTGEIKSQVATKFVAWMPTSREYGVVAETPKEMYEVMPRVRGRFMVYSAKGWRFMQSYKIADRELVKASKRHGYAPRVWSSREKREGAARKMESWSGTDEEKVRMLEDFERENGKRPSITEVMARFDVSRPTAIKYRKMAWG